METGQFNMETRVGYNQVDQHGVLRPVALIQIMEEAAIEHCRAAGKDVFALLKDGFGWMLRAGAMVVHQYPAYAALLTVGTWISRWTTFQGVREFQVMCGGKLCASTTSLWASMDLEKRHPAPVHPLYRQAWEFDQERALDLPFLKAPLEIPEALSTDRFGIRRSDMDSNRHVHNIRYLEWVLESVPEEYYQNRRMTFLEGAFLREAHSDQVIGVEVGSGEDSLLVHNVLDKTGGEPAGNPGTALATGRSRWTAV